MNIIIVGCGRVGRSIAEQLNTEGHSITAIDTNPEELAKFKDFDYLVAANYTRFKEIKAGAIEYGVPEEKILLMNQL